MNAGAKDDCVTLKINLDGDEHKLYNPGGVNDSSVAINLGYKEEISNKEIKAGDLSCKDELDMKNEDSSHSEIIEDKDFIQLEKIYMGNKRFRKKTKKRSNSINIAQKCLLEAGIHTQFANKDHSDLYICCKLGLKEKVESLLNEEIHPNVKCNAGEYEYPLHVASFKGYHEVVKVITDYIMKNQMTECLYAIDQWGNTPLICASIGSIQDKDKNNDALNDQVDHFKCMETLLIYAEDINIDAQNKSRNSALHYAVQLRNNPSYSKLLLSNGAKFDISNNNGVTPISKISCSMMEEILDSCIMNVTYENKDDISNENMNIKLDLSIFSQTSSEIKLIEAIAKSSKLKKLLSHPLISVFRSIKWRKIIQVSLFNLSTYVAFLLFLVTYVVLFHVVDKVGKHDMYCDLKIPLKIIIVVMAIYMAIRELCQLCLLRFSYFKSLDNYLEISIILLTLNFLYNEYQSVASWVILLSTLEVYFLIEKWHLSYQVALYFSMFKQVFITISKILLFLSFLLLAFSLNFTLLFNVNTGYMFPNNTITVRNFGDAVLRVFVMSTGEIDYNDLNLLDLRVSASLMLLVFIFIVILVSMNLMNALAISDLKELRNEAEFVCASKRVETILYYDKFKESYFGKLFMDSSVFSCFPDKCLVIRPNRYSVTWIKCKGHECLVPKFCLKFIIRKAKIFFKRIYSNNDDKDDENRLTRCRTCGERLTEDVHKCTHKHKTNLNELTSGLKKAALRHTEGKIDAKEKSDEKDLNTKLSKLCNEFDHMKKYIEQKLLIIEKKSQPRRFLGRDDSKMSVTESISIILSEQAEINSQS